MSSTDWFAKYNYLTSADFMDFLRLEDATAEIKVVMKQVVPGLLQTPEYAAEVIREYNGVDHPCHTAVAVRMERRQRLHARLDVNSTFIVTQPALRRSFGTYTVWRDQLLTLRNYPNLYVATGKSADQLYNLDSFTLMLNTSNEWTHWPEGFTSTYTPEKCASLSDLYDETLAQAKNVSTVDVIDQILGETSEY